MVNAWFLFFSGSVLSYAACLQTLHSNNDNWKQTNILSITYQDQKSLLAGDNQLVIYKQYVVSKL